MRKQLFYGLAGCVALLASQNITAQSIRMTSIVEGDCPNVGSTATAPRVIEMYIEGTIDLSTIEIEFQLAFQDFWQSAGTLGMGEYSDDYLYFINDEEAFDREFPGIRTAENTIEGTFPAAAFGGDKWRLSNTMTDAIIDIYGVDGVNGEEEDWNFSNSFSQRNGGFGPNSSFDNSEWNFAGADALVFEGICWDESALNATVTLQSYTGTLDTPDFNVSDKNKIYFANPVMAGSAFEIRTTSSFSNLEIYTLHGVLIEQTSILAGKSTQLQLDRSGIYLVKATDKSGSGSSIQKLIVN